MADPTPAQQPTDQAEPTRCPVAECEETVDYIALLDHLYADHDAWDLCTAVADLVAVRDDAWDGRDRARRIAVALEQENAHLTGSLATARAAALREAADVAESLRNFDRATGPRASAQVSENVGLLRVAAELRRMAQAAASSAE